MTPLLPPVHPPPAASPPNPAPLYPPPPPRRHPPAPAPRLFVARTRSAEEVTATTSSVFSAFIGCDKEKIFNRKVLARQFLQQMLVMAAESWRLRAHVGECYGLTRVVEGWLWEAKR